MAPLNEPVGYEPQAEDEWSPAIGVRNAAYRCTLFAIVLAALLAPLASRWPFLFLPALARSIWALALCWILIRTAQSAAGMYAPRITIVGVAAAGLVLGLQHAVFAVAGVPALHGVGGWWAWPTQLIEQTIATGDMLTGWGWFHPYVLVAANIGPLTFGGLVAGALTRE